MNTKGSMGDVLLVIIFITFFIIMMLFSGVLTEKLNDKIQVGNYGAEPKLVTQNLNDMYGSVVDNTTMFLFIGLCIITLILAATIIIHPAFLFLYIPSLFFTAYFAAIMSNFYQQIIENPNFANKAIEMNLSTMIMTKLPLIVFIVGAILGFVMYKAWESRAR